MPMPLIPAQSPDGVRRPERYLGAFPIGPWSASPPPILGPEPEESHFPKRCRLFGQVIALLLNEPYMRMQAGPERPFVLSAQRRRFSASLGFSATLEWRGL